MSLINAGPNEPRDVAGFLHCRRCLLEALAAEVPPQIYARLEIGVTRDLNHVQIWCMRHECNVAILELSGRVAPPPCAGPHHRHTPSPN